MFGGNARRFALAVACAVIVAALPGIARADFCAGKMNGLWCDGNNLVNCQGGSVSSSNNCQCGCQSMPPGVADQCKSCGGFCGGKANGLWCDGDNLVYCKNGSVSSSNKCDCGCKSMPPGVNDECNGCGGFCSGKASGMWCDGDNLVYCKNGSVSSSNKCDCGCKSMPQGVDDECNGCGGFCSGKASGMWCDGDNLVYCKNGSVSSSNKCDCGCKSMPQGVDDECNGCGGFCSGKGNGSWCDGANKVQCSNGSQTASDFCPNGCTGGGGQAYCKDDQPTGFCADKTNGKFCDGDSLVECKGLQAVGSQDCPAGCVTMPPGQPDQCADDVPEEFCQDKNNGKWCNGTVLITCQGGQGVLVQACGEGCITNPGGMDDECAGDPEEDFCSGRTDGLWCDGDDLAECKFELTKSSQHCSSGCVSMPPGTSDECSDDSPSGFCAAKQDGPWCDGDDLVDCQGGQEASEVMCEFGCIAMPPGTADECAKQEALGFCANKYDGFWCNADMLVECFAQAGKWSKMCADGCAHMPPGVPDVCIGEPGTACVGKGDGLWCNENLLVLCQGGTQASSVACPFGCQTNGPGIDDTCKPGMDGPPDGTLVAVKSGNCGQFQGSVNLWEGKGLAAWNQKDYPNDTLGTCDGLTIKSAGCLVTALSMLYEFLGVHRVVADQSANSPALEDEWRSQIQQDGHTRGYAYTEYIVGGVAKSGECLTMWDANPEGVAMQNHYNVSAQCVDYPAAVAIAASLNSGLPLVAGVHWVEGQEDQHWVLVVGADANGPIFVDPWGGLESLHLDDGALGSYTIDHFYTPYLAGGMGGGGNTSVVFDAQGQPASADASTGTLPAILDDEGQPQGGLVVTEDGVIEGGSGCSAGGAGGPLAIFLVLAMLALPWSLRTWPRRERN